MNPNERIQELESKNIRLQKAHNEDQELLQKALVSLKKAQAITEMYQKYCDHLLKMNSDTLEDWRKTIDEVSKQFLIGILCGCLLLWSVQNLAEILLK